MRNSLSLLSLALTSFTLSARTVKLKLYPPEVRLHAKGEGQTVMVIATDQDGVSREVTADPFFTGGHLATLSAAELTAPPHQVPAHARSRRRGALLDAGRRPRPHRSRPRHR